MNALRSVPSAPYALRRLLLRNQLFTSTLLPALPRRLRWWLRKLYFLPADAVDRIRGRDRELTPPKSMMFVGSVDDFRTSGERLVHRLVELGGLTPASRVLDVGCGIGRLAIPLTTYLGPEGSYHGLDVVPAGIEWCKENISSRYANFEFTLADVYNKEYNPAGRVPPSEYRFPYPDESFDLVVLASVFTHMLPVDMDRYIEEISRVLRRGGRCFATYSLLNDESRRLMEAGRADTRFKHELGCYATVDLKVPELAVAYDEAYVRERFQRKGLAVDGNVYYGTWCSRDPRPELPSGLGQDAVVSTKIRLM